MQVLGRHLALTDAPPLPPLVASSNGEGDREYLEFVGPPRSSIGYGGLLGSSDEESGSWGSDPGCLSTVEYFEAALQK